MTKKNNTHAPGQNLDDILHGMPEPEHFVDAAATFQQLCDSSRLRIFWIICHSEESVGSLAMAVNMTAAAVSHHLRTMKMHNLIKSRRLGQEVHYSLADNAKARFAYQVIDEYLHMTSMGGVE